MNMKKNLVFPLVVMVVFAVSRLPGCLPNNFSAAYALMFCAGAYVSGGRAWWLPLSVMVVTDLLLNFHYQASLGISTFDGSSLKYLAINYVGYAGLIWLGRRFRKHHDFLSLLGGGTTGAILFYLITNTAAWIFNPFHNPEYTNDLSGWFIALTKGTAGYPQTWVFFRNTLISGGLFTALLAGAIRLGEVFEESERKEAEPAEVGGLGVAEI